MANPRGAGKLIELVAFDKRAVVDDGYGNNVSGDWVEQFQQHAAYVPVRGAEVVLAATPSSRVSQIIRIRMSDQAKQIDASWQARDVRRGTAFNIRTVTNDVSRAYIDLLVEYGVATG